MKDKLWSWNGYIEITTSAMVGKPAWEAGVVYVDLFAGPGICTIRGSNERIPGSPLIAANAPKAFHKLLFCELDPTLADACEQRLSDRISSERFRVLQGDCNDRIADICAEIPQRALTLAFIDPTGLQVWMQTIQTLAACGAVDLLILFPDAIDIIRNADHLYFDQPDSELDRVLGHESNWRERKAALMTADPPRLRRLYSDIYKDQLLKLAGYSYFRDEVIRGPKGPLYRLIYATKHSRGVDFWDKTVKKQFGGIERLF